MRIIVAGSRAKAPSGRKSPLDDQVLLFEDLQLLRRKKRVSDVVKWADAQRIPYGIDGNGGLWTTLEALNAALGLVHRPAESEPDGHII